MSSAEVWSTSAKSFGRIWSFSACESVLIHFHRFLAIDLGGTNLRVAFIELLGSSSNDSSDPSVKIQPAGNRSSPASQSRARHVGERTWPIEDRLKNERAEDLFEWVGRCIADVVGEYRRTNHESVTQPINMGVTFSFPMM